MATQIACDFTFFQRTPEEARAGAILTVDNVQHIQNLLAMASMEFLNTEDNPLNPGLVSLIRAKLQGEIGCYRSLLNGSMAAVQENYDLAILAAELDKQKETMQSAYAQFNNGTKAPVVDITPQN